MKITCEREKLLVAFQTAASVAPLRSPKPILRNVRLDVTENQAILMATDMEVGIRIEVSGITVELPGSAVLPVDRFGMILRECTDEKLLIEADGQGTSIQGERSRFKLPGENPEEFPAVAPFEEKQYHEVPARLFKELVRRTVFAADTESSRYALGGVLLELTEDKVIGVGTDGRRLAKMEGPAHTVGPKEPITGQTIIPAHSMQLIDRALSDDDAEIQFAVRSNDILVKSPRATIYSRLVEGRFPKWRDVIPSWGTDAISIQLVVGPVYAALRQAAIVASEDSRGVDLSFSEGSLVLSGATAEVGDARAELPISYDGPPLAITLDHRFVADFFKVLDREKTITLNLKNSDSAAYFTTDDGYGYVVMPLAKDRQ